MNRKIFFTLSGIFMLGLLLRFFALGTIPVGLHRDEAFLGFNAYSLLKTGRDMTGSFLPLHLQSFLFSPAGYSYFSLPFIAIFGLTVFSTRFAAALFGSLTLLCCYFIAREIFLKQKNSEKIALLSAGSLAISPWHINLSRVATENVIVVFFLSMGIWLYFLWVRKNNIIFFLFAFLSFCIMLLTYQAPRAFLPIFLPCLFLFALKDVRGKKMLMSLSVYMLCIIIPVLMILHSPALSLRIHMLSIFQSPQTQLVLNEQIREDGISHTPYIFTRIFHNKFSGFMNTFLINYFRHFSYDFLLTDAGLPDRYRVPGMGLLYLFDLPLIILGIWMVFHKYRDIAWFLILWVLIVPIGSALTYDDVPNLQRTLLIFPALSIMTALGALYVWDIVRGRPIKTVVHCILVLMVILSFFYYLHAYYIHQIYHRPWYREEGFSNLIPAVNAFNNNYQYALITSAEPDPAIFFLFYNRYDPASFQKLYKAHPSPFYGNISFSKYQFPGGACPMFDSQQFIGNSHVLYVNGGVCKTPRYHARVLKEIKREDGSVVFTLLQFVP